VNVFEIDDSELVSSTNVNFPLRKSNLLLRMRGPCHRSRDQ
jgi:hypothetical protein